MQQFLKIIECLKRDEFYAIVVEDPDTNYQITVNVQGKNSQNLTGALLVEHFGSVENFFNKLFSDGYEKIKIYFRRKNGTVYKTVGEPKIFVLNGEKKAQVMPEKKYAPDPDLETEPKGLNRAQYNALRYPEVVKERDEYKEKLSRAKKKIKKLERAELENKFSTAKSEQNKEMLLGIAPHLVPVLSKFFGGNAPVAGMISDVAGMAAPEMSQIKMQVMQRISNLDDELVYFIGLLAENMNDESVQASVIEVVKNHGLEPDHNG